MRFNLRYKTLDEHSVIMSKDGLENQLEKEAWWQQCKQSHGSQRIYPGYLDERE